MNNDTVKLLNLEEKDNYLLDLAIEDEAMGFSYHKNSYDKNIFKQLISEVNKTLFDYEQIQKVVIRTEDFPRTPAMKIIRPKKVY